MAKFDGAAENTPHKDADVKQWRPWDTGARINNRSSDDDDSSRTPGPFFSARVRSHSHFDDCERARIFACLFLWLLLPSLIALLLLLLRQHSTTVAAFINRVNCYCSDRSSSTTDEHRARASKSYMNKKTTRAACSHACGQRVCCHMGMRTAAVERSSEQKNERVSFSN